MIDIVKKHLEESEKLGEPVTKLIAIDPEMATELLGYNIDNRTIRRDTVALLANDMKLGHWQGLNGQTIIISKDGKLNDGQHRCLAIKSSGKTITMLVVFGVNRESRETIDRNMVRTIGDYLSMQGKSNGMVIGCASKYLLGLEGDSEHGLYRVMRSSHRFSKSQILVYADQHYEFLSEIITKLTKFGFFKVISKTKLVTAYTHIFNHVGDNHIDILDKYFHGVISGDNLSGNSPIKIVRNNIQNKAVANKWVSNKKPWEDIELIIRGWNSFVTGRTPNTINVTGKLPSIASSAALSTTHKKSLSTTRKKIPTTFTPIPPIPVQEPRKLVSFAGK